MAFGNVIKEKPAENQRVISGEMEHADWFKYNHRIFLPSELQPYVFGAWGVKEKSFGREHMNPLSKLLEDKFGDDLVFPVAIAPGNPMNGNPPGETWKWEWPKWPEFLTFEPAESITKFAKQLRNIFSNSQKKDVGQDIIRPDGITIGLPMNGKPLPGDLNEDKSEYLISELEPGELRL